MDTGNRRHAGGDRDVKSLEKPTKSKQAARPAPPIYLTQRRKEKDSPKPKSPQRPSTAGRFVLAPRPEYYSFSHHRPVVGPHPTPTLLVYDSRGTLLGSLL